MLVGLGLSAAGVGGAELQPVAFNDSLLVGILGADLWEAMRTGISLCIEVASGLQKSGRKVEVIYWTG